MAILQYLHFAYKEYEALDKTNKMWKMQDVIDYLTKGFSSVYVPRPELSVGETVLKCKGWA